MVEYWEEDEINVIKKNISPVSVRLFEGVENAEELLKEKPACISFKMESVADFRKKGAYAVLDFGKELCGSLRFVTRAVTNGPAMFRITLGESLSEACSNIGEKNATNDHSPRDFTVMVSNMSDLTFGLSGFRFARIELLSETRTLIRNIFAVSMLPKFEKEGYITTSDEELNRIIDTAIYTLKLNFQNGYIWDGIKRDRLVWSGDLNQEIISSIYLFGDNQNITNSLTFLRDETPESGWINTIPTYSAWWCVNLCDYCRLTGNREYFENNKEYAKKIFAQINGCIGAHGFSTFMSYYILTADGRAKGKNMLAILKEYFGAMLSRGATTFWEDFHMDWLEGSGRIDELPKEGEKDIHGDYGAFCYKGFRHSLCHGWASGVLAFIYEYMLGLKLTNGGQSYEVNPNPMGVKEIHAKIPMKTGWLEIGVVDGVADIQNK